MRNEKIDIIRGLSIILVVLGHSIQYSVNNYDSNYLFRCIYSFHMPLFMVISGYTINFSRDKLFKLKWIEGKIISLVIPYITWLIIPAILNGSDIIKIYYIVRDAIIYPNNQLWFLWILFMNCLVFYLSKYLIRIINKTNDALLLVPLLFLVVEHFTFKSTYFGLNLLMWYYSFYLLGYYLSKYKMVFNKVVDCSQIHIYFKGFLIVTFLFAAYFWQRNSIASFFSYLNCVGIVAEIINYIYRYFVSILGMISIYYITGYLNRVHLGTYISKLGRITLEIYVLHEFFFELFIFESCIINIFSRLICGLFIPFLIMTVEQKGYLRMILFGRR